MDPGEPPEKDEIDVRAALGVASEVYRKNFRLLMLLALILVVPIQIATWQQIDSVVFGLILLPVSLVAATWFWGCSIVAAMPVREGEERTLSDLIAAVWPMLLPLVLLTILSDIPTFFGYGMLIAPGLFLSLMWLVAFPVMLFEGKRALESMSRSSALTLGHRVNLIWIAVIIWFPRLILVGIGFLFPASDSLANMAAYTVVDALLVPFQGILVAVTYYGLMALTDPEKPGADTGTFDDRASHRLAG